MTVYEGLTFAVIVVLGAATTVAIYVGLLGMLGQFYVVRCAVCNHVTFSSVDRPQQSCPYCRHPVLLHPFHAFHHPSDVSAARADYARHRPQR